MTKKEMKVVETLKAMIENTQRVANYFKQEGDELTYIKFLNEISGLNSALYLLTDKDYLSKAMANYEIDID